MKPALPHEAWIVALAALPEVGPARLAALLESGEAAEVFDRLATRRFTPSGALEAAVGSGAATLVARWQVAAAALDVDALWQRHVDAGVAVLVAGGPSWSERFAADPDPPLVLFAAGQPALLDAAPSVAVVGTRDCTRYGWDVANRLGAELATAGIHVVSGLARGIDGAAHRGAVDAGGSPPIGVVGTGIDVVYPAGNRRLWGEVIDTGVLVTEAPLGSRPTRWRFPARNRIIAALADVVVVVESADRGGALHTVDEAIRRDRPVLAVPGPITSRASVGTNRLLAEVAQPCCDTADVFVALGSAAPVASRAPAPARLAPDPDGAAVLDALGWDPAPVGAIADRAGLDPAAASVALLALAATGWVAQRDGWWERVA